MDDAMMSMLEVQPAALMEFSKDFGETSNEGTSAVAESIAKIGKGEFGRAPVEGGAKMMRQQSIVMEQLQAWTKDLMKAVPAFATAAQTIAANYVISDDAALDEMSDVQDVFDVANVPVGQQTIQQILAAKIENKPAVTSKPLPLPDSYTATSSAPPPGSGASTPDEEVAEFLDFDESTNNGNGLEDAYPSEDAPLELQLERNNADSKTPSLLVVDSDGNLKRVPNPTYTAPPRDPLLDT